MQPSLPRMRRARGTPIVLACLQLCRCVSGISAGVGMHASNLSIASFLLSHSCGCANFAGVDAYHMFLL